MKPLRTSLPVVLLSLACSSEPSTDDTQNGANTSGDTSSTGAASTSSTGATSTGTTQTSTTTTGSPTSTAPQTSATQTSSAGSSSVAPQTSSTSSNASTGTGDSSTESDDESSYVETSATSSSTSNTESEATSSESEGSDTSSAAQTSDEGGGECVKGMTSGNQVLMIGESFIAASHGITRTIEELARANGSLAQGESYGDRSVSGTRLTGGGEPTITNQYVQYSGRDQVKYVLMDGGGNDCLQAAGQQPASALGAAEALLGEMASSGVEKVVYFFYPDPLPPIGNDSLKSCLDTLRPQMKELCDGLTSPECHWLDLREVWDGHPEYTQDGIHPTPAGDTATGEAIWEVMVENCVAQ